MCKMMELVLPSQGGRLLPTVPNDGIQRDRANPERALLVGGHDAHRFIVVRFHLKTLARGEMEESQHVTARDRRHERLLRIQTRRVRIRNRNDGRGRGRRDGEAAIKSPNVFTGVFARAEIGAVAIPTDDGAMLMVGHKVKVSDRGFRASRFSGQSLRVWRRVSHAQSAPGNSKPPDIIACGAQRNSGSTKDGVWNRLVQWKKKWPGFCGESATNPA
jgi:hypothetical protein